MYFSEEVVLIKIEGNKEIEINNKITVNIIGIIIYVKLIYSLVSESRK